LWYILIAIGVIVFIILFFVSAEYGRYNSKKWGPQIDNTLGWMIMECIPPIIFVTFFILGNRQSNLVALVFLLIWEIHYIHRAFIYPLKIRGKKQIPILIVIMGMIFNGFNGYIQGRYLFELSPIHTNDWLLTPMFIIGTIIFIIGFLINLNSDHILRNLRKPGEVGYKIPHNGFFRWVSCPNYFGELLEWMGWAILTWSFAGLFFFLWTAANLVPRAYSHHKWYIAKFPDYPKNRKAIFPFIF